MNIGTEEDWWKTLFDEVYLLTDARSVGDEEITRKETDVICELLAPGPADRILDLCGGDGRHCRQLSARGFRSCTVLDYSRTLLSRGRKASGEQDLSLAFIQADARYTALMTSVFDHVLIMGNSLGYLPDESGDIEILREAFRVLRPGGTILLDVADGSSARERLNPRAWHEIGEDILVCRNRILRGNSIHTREVVLSRKRGLVRDRSYTIRLYGPEKLGSLVGRVGFTRIETRNGFSPHGKSGDYGFMNDRILLTARKP